MLRVLYIDEHLVAIDKPAGLLAHRTALDAGEQRFALQMLRDQLGRMVWPAHRLDKGTSGVLLFALDASVASLLGTLFESAQMSKQYLALVRGWPDVDEGVIDHALARDPERASAGQELLPSRTAWRVRQRLEWKLALDPRFETSRFALIEVSPQSGRRHQIRRHLKHIAHPIVGDSTHGKGPLNRAVADFLGLQRLWLHAQSLAFKHPLTGQPLKFEAAPGPEWGLLTRGPEWALLDHPDRQT